MEVCSLLTSFKAIIFIILFYCCVHSGVTLSPNSGLCERNNKTCSHQISPNSPHDTCQMVYYLVNSSQCMDLILDEASSTQYLGTSNLQAYHYTHSLHYQTCFNVSFHDILWTTLKFRFKQDGWKQKNTCREFVLIHSQKIDRLFYDCLWSLQEYEGKEFTFEYEASNDTLTEYKMYKFKVPLDSRINPMSTKLEDWEIFSYVEIRPSKIGLTTFVLYFQPLPADYGVGCYQIDVMVDSARAQTDIICTTQTVDVLTYSYSAWLGTIQFTVQPISNQSHGECFISRTPIFTLGAKHTKSIVIGIVSTAVILPTLCYILFLLRNTLLRKTKKWIKKSPKLLIIYTPSISSHFNVVRIFVKYLKSVCNVEPLWDEQNIPKTISKDPFKWCNEHAIDTADYIMLLSSPFDHLRCSDAVYKTDKALLNLLSQRFALNKLRQKCFSLVLPYCTKNNLPDIGKNLVTFTFPKDLNPMIRFIHNDWKVSKLCCLPLPGGFEDYRTYGSELEKALEQAHLDIKNNSYKYEKLQCEMKTDNDVVELCQDNIPLVTTAPRSNNKKLLKNMVLDGESCYPGDLSRMNLLGNEGNESLESIDDSCNSTDGFDLNTLDL